MVIDIDIHICNKQTSERDREWKRERERERGIKNIFPYKEDEGYFSIKPKTGLQ